MLKGDIDTNFVQDGLSYSKMRGTARGLHFQAPPYAQDKLISVVCGKIFDVAVDIRNGSPTYGQWYGTELSATNGKQLYIPIGFLHGFVTLKNDTKVVYKCSDFYAAECDHAIQLNDPGLGIDWPVPQSDMIVSEKDISAHEFKTFESPFIFQEKTP